MAQQKFTYRPILIEVAQEDISIGCRKNSSSCPIALAIKRKLDCDLVWVTKYGVKAVKNNKGVFAYLPRSAVSFIYSFDNNLLATPFDFFLKFERVKIVK